MRVIWHSELNSKINKMFSVQQIPFSTSGVLNKLVEDYLNKTENTKTLYEHFPDLSGFKNILKQNTYSQLNRKGLYETIKTQSTLVKNTSHQSIQNIELLSQPNTYTVTTGHQLCLFTGPLYFIYKILTTIKLAENLKKEFPENNFVPVYWMAGEDHDFEEINHLHVFGKKIEWHTEQKGAVGNFKTENFNAVLEELKLIFGNTEPAQQLLHIFENSYLQHDKLNLATRALTNELFGKYGLVIVDGQDDYFKKQFITFFKKDIFENLSYHSCKQTIEFLEKNNYSVQVNPREINCFYLNENARNRIELKDGYYHLVGTETKFTKEELNQIIDSNPEKISPNVVLRPLYQQCILPNLAYVGGPGELAYWLEYKKMFEDYKIQLPVIVPRNFITVIEKTQKNKIEKLQLEPEDFFKTEKEIIDAFQIKHNSVFDVSIYKEKLNKVYAEIEPEINLVDKSLISSLQAELQKSLNGLSIIEGKANKALKQKSETEINQIKTIKQKLFPANIPQERFDNFSNYVIKYGFTFIDEVKEKINVFEFNQKLIIED